MAYRYGTDPSPYSVRLFIFFNIPFSASKWYINFFGDFRKMYHFVALERSEIFLDFFRIEFKNIANYRLHIFHFIECLAYQFRLFFHFKSWNCSHVNFIWSICKTENSSPCHHSSHWEIWKFMMTLSFPNIVYLDTFHHHHELG